MKPFGQFHKTILSASVTLLFAIGATQVAVAQEVPFEGKVNLCAVDFTHRTVEEKGKGKIIERDMVYLYRIVTDYPAINGWDVMTFDFTTDRDGRQYTTGDIFFIPDEYAAGAFQEQLFNLLITDSMPGRFLGLGSLAGVTVDYTLSVNLPEAEYCFDHPYCDDHPGACFYLPELGAPPIGYDFTGTVYISE